MEVALLVCVGILSYFFMREITGIKIMSLLHEVVTTLLHGAIKSAGKYREATAQAFSRMSLDQKRKSTKYRYYCFINDVLSVFGLQERGVNVEGFTIGIVIISIICGVVVGFLTTSFAYVIIVSLIALPLLISFVFLGSRMKVRARKIDLLDSMDMICACMSDGFLLAVRDCYSQFPETVRPYFKRFINNVELLNMSMPQAIDTLNTEIGDLYDEFCDSVIAYELNRASGMETLFNFYISENGKTQARDRRIKRMSDAANLDFFASVGVIALFGVFSSHMLGDTGSLWDTPFGKIVLVALIISGAAVFIYIQYLLSKSLRYTEKDK